MTKTRVLPRFYGNGKSDSSRHRLVYYNGLMWSVRVHDSRIGFRSAFAYLGTTVAGNTQHVVSWIYFRYPDITKGA